MILGIIVGCALGLGIVLTVWGLYPPRQPLHKRLDDLDDPNCTTNKTITQTEKLGQHSARLLSRCKLPQKQLASSLRVSGYSLEQLALAKVASLVIGGAFPLGIWFVALLVKVWVSPFLVAIASLVIGTLMFLLPDLLLRQKTKEQRKDFRHQMSVYLDLVGLHLSSGSGIERAMVESAKQGTAWGFVELQRSLQQAQLANKPLWGALEKLAEDLESSELAEIAAWLFLAGNSGSRVRSSLHIKAKGLRERALYEAEEEAQLATERMSLPVVLLFAGFLGLIGYPALAAIAGS
ncbi:MAG: type II secretion system F family protein [bacterium]|nr:type II secretion system F family protein [bacterium]MCY4258174.1 type II secretion system F family protein [bacterium]